MELRCTYDSLLEREVSHIVGRDIEVLFDILLLRSQLTCFNSILTN